MSTRTDNDIGPKLIEQMTRFQKTLGQHRKALYHPGKPNTFESGTVDQCELKAVVRHDLVFKAAGRSNKQHFIFRITQDQFLRDGDSGIYVSAGSAGSD